MYKPDYANYSNAELNDVLAHIDKDANPDNFQRLLAEISTRKQNAARKSAPADDETTSKTDESKPDEANPDELKDYWDPVQAKKQQEHLSRFYGFALIATVLGIASLPAYFHSFLIHQEYYTSIKITAWAVTFISLVICVLKGPKKLLANITDKQRKRFKLTSKQKEANFDVARFIAFTLVIAGVSFWVTYKTSPVLAHMYVFEQVKTFKVVTVAKKRSRYRRKYCNGKVYLTEFSYATFDYVCGVLSRETWETLEKGDKIRIFGTQSKLGFLVTGARKEKLLNRG